MVRRLALLVVVAAIAQALAGCGTAYQQGAWYAEHGQWEKAVVKYMQAAQEADKAELDKGPLQMALKNAALQASAVHYERGVRLLSKPDVPGAAAEFKRALAYDPDDEEAREMLAGVHRTLMRYGGVSQE